MFNHLILFSETKFYLIIIAQIIKNEIKIKKLQKKNKVNL